MITRWLSCTALLAAALPSPIQAADAPARTRRADAFVGIHFDFHAGADCTNVGARTTREMVGTVIDKVRPDYIQIDCKGHPGYSSYPTKAGNPAPGFVGDPLRVWRDVTRERGTALFMHYSGVWDRRAVALHPDWAARNADGKPNEQATSTFGPYVDQLLIPQLRELAGAYGVDGMWVDGDCWGATVDYSEPAVRAFREQSAVDAPRKAGEPLWNDWLEFNREAFRRYLRHYVDALKSSHPDFEVISNWAFSDHMPEPVTANVAALSGDFSPDDSVNSARFAGRCIENQGRPWDLMSWSFSRATRKQKPAVQLMQEAAVVLAEGGGYQAYFTMNRDGSVRLGELDVMAAVADFCRERRSFCHRSEAVPQIALLYSRTGHYRTCNRLFHPSGSPGIGILRQTLTGLLKDRQSVQIVGEHHLSGRMAQWPLIVVPGWTELDPAFRDELANHVRTGGRLLLIGDGPARLFATDLSGAGEAAKTDGAVVTVGSGQLGLLRAPDGPLRDVVQKLFPFPLAEVEGGESIDVSVRRLGGRLAIHLVNTAGPHADRNAPAIEAIPPATDVRVALRLARAPGSIVLQPGNVRLESAWADGVVKTTVPKLDLYSILVIED